MRLLSNICNFYCPRYPKMRSTIRLPKGKGKDQKVVYKLTHNTTMKFRPERDAQEGSFLVSRIKSLSKLFSRADSITSRDGGSTVKKQQAYSPLKFLHRLEHDSYLIGNGLQLDALSISVIDDYIETEHLWSFKAGQPILKLLVDDRRKIIVLVVQGEIRIYSYQARRSRNPPKLRKSFRNMDEVQMMQMARDSFLVVFFEKSVCAYALDAENSRQTSRKQFKFGEKYGGKRLKLYRAAQCAEHVLNLFFESQCDDEKKKGTLFELHCLPIEVIGQSLNLCPAHKIYDIESRLHGDLTVESVNKECYFMNLGQELFLFIRGYRVDTVQINYQTGGSLLKSFGDKKLMHITPIQIDFYDLKIDLASNPPRITIHSTDSVPVDRAQNQQLLDAIKFDEHFIGFFFQQPIPNSLGQVRYHFSLTKKWDFEEKVASLLPKVSEYTWCDNPDPKKGEKGFEDVLLEKVEVACDAVGKMGMSRKEAYLRMWSSSKREQLDEFKLLLDTKDYATIRDEILLKLKKKAMVWAIVHKMEMGCLGVIGDDLFAPKAFTHQHIKNYLISHFLGRKLELFKELRLYLKSQKGGKADSGLNIDIQEYTNVVQMDVKAYLLELIYTMCKYKKDFIMEIRIIIRKFRFALRHIYLELLQDIALTVKQDLLYLLQNIPEILPYEHIFPQGEAPIQPLLYKGVFAPLSDENWDRTTHANTVATIYNRDMLEDFSRTVWVKRNWLTYHDMVFKTRLDLQNEQQYLGGDGEDIFLSILTQIYANFTHADRIKQMINHIQDTYVKFPPYLYSNVFLYRALFEYFKGDQVLDEDFTTFLRRKDEDIFKKIFDHEKVKKGSLLRQIKPIYESMGMSDKFNYGLLKFFSSPISQLSDIKYLLNRINNEKIQFHAENEEMYEVLVKGMQIKLKLGSKRDIPINQVLIYIENIPLTAGNPVTQELQVLQKINRIGNLFQAMKLNMSVFEMIRNRDAVLLATLAYHIQTKGIPNHPEKALQATPGILNDTTEVRGQIYGPSQDTTLLFLYLTELMKTQALLPVIHPIINQQSTPETPFTPAQLESLVFFCYKRQLSAHPKYTESKGYLTQLVALLPEDSSFRKFVQCEIELAALFGTEIRFPICGQTGVLTKRHLISLIESLPKKELLALDVARLHQLGSALETIAIGSSSFTEHDLAEIAFVNLLRLRALPQAVKRIEPMYDLEPDSPNNPLYPLLIFRCLFFELTEQNKNIMSSLMARKYGKCVEKGRLFTEMLGQSWSNEGQKNLMTTAMEGSGFSDQFSKENPLFNDYLIEFLKENPDQAEGMGRLFARQFSHLLRCQEDFIKSPDILLMHMIVLHDPFLLLRYIDVNRYTMNFKQVRAFFSFLSKFELFDPVKVLQFGKRVCMVIYEHERGAKRLKDLTSAHFELPLIEVIDVPAMPAANANQQKLAKGVERMKAKLKSRMSSSAIKKRASNSNIGTPKERWNKKLREYISDPTLYLPATDYPFNDSDDYCERRDALKQIVSSQGIEGGWFASHKWLTWFFKRTNQPIQYYLLKESEGQIDAIMKQEEDKLRLSFRASPRNKELTENAQMVAKSFQKLLPEEVAFELPPGSEKPNLGTLAISAIPHVQESAISAIKVVEEMEEVKPESAGLKDELLATVKQEEERVTFDACILNNITCSKLEGLIPHLIRDIYSDTKLDYTTTLQVLRELYTQQARLTPISTEAIEMYSKMEHLQKKVGLGLDMRQVLPVDGLMSKEKGGKALFEVVKPYLLPFLNENNVHTLAKVASLAFKHNPLQQDIANQFLVTAILAFDQPIESAFDEGLQLEKIVAFAKQMQLVQLKMQADKVLPLLTDSVKQKKVAGAIGDILRERNDRTVQQFTKKWGL